MHETDRRRAGHCLERAGKGWQGLNHIHGDAGTKSSRNPAQGEEESKTLA